MSEDKKCCANTESIKDYKSAFECFKQRFLVEKKSIFRCDSDDVVLTPDSINYLINYFVNNGYSGDASFIEKIKHQLIESHQKKDDQKNAIEILATAVWLWKVPPANAKDRSVSVKEILKLHSELETIDLENNPFFEDFTGFASTGTYYNTNKPIELAYIIKFFEKYINSTESDLIAILKSDDFNGKMKIITTKDYSKYKDGKKDKSGTELKIDNKPYTSHDKARTVSIHNALLHLFDSENYEPILSNDHKDKISKTFKKIFNIEEDDIDMSIIQIKEKLLKLNIYTNQPHFFYENNIKNIWQGGLDFESKNMILHGAPGTGKTYSTEETIKARKLIENNSEYELVQFHSSYGYEDFIEGIKPIGLNDGQMNFALKNGIFKQMCIDAFNNLIESQSDKTKLKTYYFIADEINRAELSRVFGELLLCLEDDKRLKIIDGKVVGTKVKLPNSALWENDHVVVFADNEDQLLEKSKSTDKKEWYFGVPENVYFIGTMNDIDRSVDSFDMALRRRFVWKHYRCDYDVVEHKYESDAKLEGYIKVCQELNNYITNEKGFNLNNSYELGQSYFMKPNKLTQKELDRVWIEHIAPILREYLRAEYNQNEIEQHLQKAKELYKI